MTMFTRKVFLLYLLLILSFAVSAQNTLPDGVKLSYWAYKKDIKTIISDLHDITDVNISYDDDIIPTNKKVLVNVKNKTLGYTLRQVFKGTNLKYRIIGNQLEIIKDEFSNLLDDHYTISGIVRDSLSKERLIYAAVYIGDGSIGTVTNEYGFYTLTIPKGLQDLQVSYVGYSLKTIPLSVKKEQKLNIDLNPSILLNEIVILDTKIESTRKVADAVVLPIQDLNSMGTFGGEPDVVRFALLQEGVTGSADGFGGINVRGGSIDQNLILLDGVPVYNSSHSFGLFSIFNPYAIKSAQLIKNGFPGRYGGRLSSVLDIWTKDGNKEKFSGNLKFSPFISSVSLQGPLGSDKNSFFLSGRRTVLDPFIKPISRYYYDATFQEGETNYYFYDINAKLNLALSESQHWTFSYYKTQDKFQNDNKSFHNQEDDDRLDILDNDNWNWGNQIASFRWNMILGKKTTANIGVHYSDFHHDSFQSELLSLFQTSPADTSFINNAGLYKSAITDIGGHFDMYIQSGKVYNARLGLSYTNHTFGPGILQVNERSEVIGSFLPSDQMKLEDDFERPELQGDEVRAYMENEFKFGKSTINAGLHIAMVTTADATNIDFQPRFSSAIHLGGNSFFKLSYSHMNQYMHFLTSSGFGLPTDIWLPSTDKISPERSQQISGGLDLSLGNSWRMTLMGYNKVLNDIITFPEGSLISIDLTPDWEDRVQVGSGSPMVSNLR